MAMVARAELSLPTWRGWIHAVACALAVPGALVLLLRADGGTERWAALVYGMGLVVAFGSSACYHRTIRSERARHVLRRLDHSMIYVLIAGTYTPVCLVGLPPEWGIPLLWTVWAGAAIGVLLKQLAFHRFDVIGYVLYPLLGWAAVLAAPALVRSLDRVELTLLLTGGLIYTAGIPVLFRRRPDPWPATFGYHEVWHLATVLAGACHFATVLLLVG
jgi:hemolysin III